MKKAKYILFAYLSIITLSTIIVGDALAFVFLKVWQALAICLPSIVFAGALFGVTMCCFDKANEDEPWNW